MLYGLLEMHGVNVCHICCHDRTFCGTSPVGLFVRSSQRQKYNAQWYGCMPCCHRTLLLLSSLWIIGLIVSGYFSGGAVAAWGFFSEPSPKNDRIKSCADVLIYSNLLMIAVNVVAMNGSPFIGLSLAMLCLVIGIAFIWILPVRQENDQSKTFINKTHGGIKPPILLSLSLSLQLT